MFLQVEIYNKNVDKTILKDLWIDQESVDKDSESS